MRGTKQYLTRRAASGEDSSVFIASAGMSKNSARALFVNSPIGTTPAVTAGLEEKPWSLEKVVEMTEAYWLTKKQIKTI
jgi:hypothetical protein